MRRSWYVVLTAAVLVALPTAAAGVAAAALLVPVRGAAEVTLLLRPLPGNAYAAASRDPLSDLETEAELPTSDDVLARVVQQVPGTTAQGVRSRMSARVVPRTEVLAVQVRAATRPDALQLAGALGEATLDVRTERAVEALQARGTRLQRSLEEAERALVEERSRRDDADAGADAVLSRRVVALRGELRGTDQAPSGGSVLGTTPLPQSRRQSLLAAGVAAGALAGGATVVILRRRPRPGPRRGRA